MTHAAGVECYYHVIGGEEELDLERIIAEGPQLRGLCISGGSSNQSVSQLREKGAALVINASELTLPYQVSRILSGLGYRDSESCIPSKLEVAAPAFQHQKKMRCLWCEKRQW